MNADLIAAVLIGALGAYVTFLLLREARRHREPPHRPRGYDSEEPQ